ncbi:MAG: hypothetical protein QM642_01220 [Edaphocola sp.]
MKNLFQNFTLSRNWRKAVALSALSALLVITDLQGNRKAIYRLIKGENIVSVNTELLASGVYLYSLFVDGKVINTQRLSVIH